METKRPVNPAAEEILGGYFPVLDHGFVALIDYMGTDETVERAARVSYGYGTRQRSQTRALIRYLRRHQHTTPSEMVELQFHCGMPLFVARQWVRHRTACLAAGTEVYFDASCRTPSSGTGLEKVKIEDVWRRFRPVRNGLRSEEQRNHRRARSRVQTMMVRQVDEDALRLRATRVLDVFRNGRKPVFRMVLADGKQVEATADHRFLFAGGWRTLREATGLRALDGKAVWRPADYYVHVDGAEAGVTAPAPRPPGVDHESREARGTRSGTARLVRIERFDFVGEKVTYDLEVEGPYHNFVANGIVTHNSVNEYSGRYSLIPLLFYRPGPENFALQSRASRQGRGSAASDALYDQAVARWERGRTEAAGTYTWLVGEDVARELARIDLPLSTYTQWYWKIDLHNLMHFLTVRVEDHAQWEIREFARVIAGILKRVAPLSYEAWLDYDLAGRRFSRAELDVLDRLLDATEAGIAARPACEHLPAEALEGFGLSKREVGELLDKLRRRERPDFELDISRMRSAAEMEARMRAAVPESAE